ncbi:MAG: dUTP diphosphatase [Pseudomonadota bacterium]
MREALVTMLRMQDRMNTRVHDQWRSQGFAWHRAIWIECAELIDHHGYKWWKHQEPDLAQVQLEIVDIWHFGMSALLVEYEAAGSVQTLVQAIEESWNTPRAGAGIVESAEQLAGTAAGEARFDVGQFAQLVDASGLGFTELFRQYLGKNVLNFFRQDHGYKEGTYLKQWGGREDNEHLVELLADVDTQAKDAEQRLYGALSERYSMVS